jgi:hypothetical protein
VKESFIDRKFSLASLALIKKANEILAEYEAAGYDLSVRQLYYQFVARDIIPNTTKSYSNLSSVISDGRKAGMIDWGMILDRGRVVVSNSHWKTPKEILESAATSFAIDKWLTQPNFVYVMVEKQALEGVLQPVCSALDVPFLANKGYCSDSTMYRVGKRIEHARMRGKEPVVIYLGDHDPSGIDMTRDVTERLEMYSGGPVDVLRVALNMDQIRRLRPPENPAKSSDSRFDSYVERFGTSSWELDAIEPNELAQIVRTNIIANRDEDEWDKAVEREDNMKIDLQRMADDYEEEQE